MCVPRARVGAAGAGPVTVSGAAATGGAPPATNPAAADRRSRCLLAARSGRAVPRDGRPTDRPAPAAPANAACAWGWSRPRRHHLLGRTRPHGRTLMFGARPRFAGHPADDARIPDNNRGRFPARTPRCLGLAVVGPPAALRSTGGVVVAAEQDVAATGEDDDQGDHAWDVHGVSSSSNCARHRCPTCRLATFSSANVISSYV